MEEIKLFRKHDYINDDRCDLEIWWRIGRAKDEFQKLEKVLKIRKPTMNTKIRVLDCYALSILLYGSISSPMKQAPEPRFYRQMVRISWTDYVTNEEVLRRAGTTRKLINTLRTIQLQSLGHVMRKEGLENLAITGRPDGTRSKGDKTDIPGELEQMDG